MKYSYQDLPSNTFLIGALACGVLLIAIIPPQINSQSTN